MRISSKGRVTIPKSIRDRHGMLPGERVVFLERGGVVVLMRSDHDDLAAKTVAAMRGSGNGRLTTDQVMALTRPGDDEH
jgi:AbrB family looped-hinge helix DNA binding protein